MGEEGAALGEEGAALGEEGAALDDVKRLSRAVFLDRDGVLVEERPLVAAREPLTPAVGVANALKRMARAGHRLFVVTNQAVVARGLVTETELSAQHAALAEAIIALGGPRIEAFFVCPHHPHAQVDRYRIECTCRKPRPGLLVRASQAFGVELERSWMIGDRPSDVAAGRRAGCRTILLRGPATADVPIVGAEALGAEANPDSVFTTLGDAARHIEASS